MLAVFAGAAIALALGSSPMRASAQQPIKVGLTTDSTGVAAAFARSQINGVQMAIDELNKSGGVLNRKVELITRDSQLKPDLGTSHTRDLITGEKVDVLIGPAGSAVGITVSAMARQYRKVVMMTIPNSPRITTEQFHSYVFSIVPSGLMEARAMAEAVGPRFKRIAFIGGDYEAAHQNLKFFRDRLAKVHPEAQIVAQAWPKLGEQDYSSYITRLMSAKPDLVYSYLWGADLVGFVKQAKPYGVFDKSTFASLTYLDDIKALGADLPEGVIGQMRAPFFALTSDKARKFTADYRARFNDWPTDWAFMGYEGMQLLAAGIQAAGSTESDAIVKALEQVRYEGLRGTISLRALDHLGNVPSFIGTTVADKETPFRQMKAVQRIPAEAIWPSADEVARLREAK
ncbi:ABC transporter substrate-binding protein [Variovorax defluvii]|uniref:ABC transporter substrate-binding protein n=1 Tax=Variovorax defluvii TaxID=913761 RepID=A0ABP8HES7_9BURK